MYATELLQIGQPGEAFDSFLFLVHYNDNDGLETCYPIRVHSQRLSLIALNVRLYRDAYHI